MPSQRATDPRPQLSPAFLQFASYLPTEDAARLTQRRLTSIQESHNETALDLLTKTFINRLDSTTDRL